MPGLLDGQPYGAGLLGNFQRGLAQIAGGPQDPIAAARLKFLMEQARADQAFREAEARRAQSNADRAFGEGQRQFDIGRTPTQMEREKFDFMRSQAVEKPKVEWQEGDSGSKEPFLVTPQGAVKRVPIEGEAPAGGNPFAQGKMTEAQSKDATYASRMLMSEKVLRSPGVEGAALDMRQRGLATAQENLPFGMGRLGVGRNLVPEGYQKYDQAKRDFINAVLRRESGAVISPSEFDNADKQYFPVPGDTPQVLAQKRANRAEAIRGIASGAGKGYRPPLKFDDKGELVPTGQPGVATGADNDPLGLRR